MKLLANWAPWRLNSLSLHRDLDLIPLHSHRVGRDAAARTVEVAAIGKAETPAVPGAGDGSIKDDAVAQGRALVGTGIVDGVIGALVEEDGDRTAVDIEVSPLALGNLTHLRNRLEPFGRHHKTPGLASKNLHGEHGAPRPSGSPLRGARTNPMIAAGVRPAKTPCRAGSPSHERHRRRTQRKYHATHRHPQARWLGARSSRGLAGRRRRGRGGR